MIILVLIASMLLPSFAHAATYYISPTGSNSNNGTSTGSPWLTFAYAINASRAWCGDTLILLDGIYGDGTSTGKINLLNVTCTQSSQLTIQSQNQRKAKIVDNGSGVAVKVDTSSYLVFDGLYVTSTNNTSSIGDRGRPFEILWSNHIILKNNVGKNPNKYSNSHIFPVLYSQDILLEDNEGYDFHRHCTTGFQVERMVVRRQYCNPRIGAIPGGVGSLGKGDAVFSMYPCTNCILENSIAEGDMFLNEMNATFDAGVLMSGSKVLGSVCLGCSRANGIHLNPRKAADLNHTPQNILIRDVALLDFNSPSSMIRCQDCVNVTIDHVSGHSIYTATVQGNGVSAEDSSLGTGPTDNSVIITNSVMTGSQQFGFRVTGYNSWSGDRLYSFGNGTNYSPSLPSNWTNASTVNPQVGACKVWVHPSSPLKGAGSNGSDIGPTILYRYIDGVLTSTPLWDTTTGEFPHGEADLDGTNRVAGDSLHDVHLRLNINAGGCAFPDGYASPGGGGASGPANPATHATGVGVTNTNATITINAGDDGLIVGVAAYANSGAVGIINQPVSSCGSQTITALVGGESVTSPANRRVNVFGITNPNSGTCTITVTTGGNVNAVAMVAIRIPVMGSFGTPAVGVHPVGVATSTPSVTAGTNTGETIIDFVAGKCAPSGGVCTTSWSVGADQVWQSDAQAIASDIRLIVSEQDGADGGIMSHTAGQAYLWAMVAVPIIPGAPDPPSTSTFRISNYRIYSLHGSQENPEVSLGPLAVQNNPAEIGATGEFRLRAEIIVENATSASTGIIPYCKKVGGSFVPVANGFGSGFVRYYGSGAEPTIPASLTPTTQRFGGNFVPGVTSRDSALAVTLPVMAANTRTEIDYQFAVGNGLVAGDVVECEIRRDNGSTLGVHTFPLRINIAGPRASMGF